MDISTDPDAAPQQPDRQPWLHDLSLTLAAPTQVWSSADGQVGPGGLAGIHHADRRVVCLLRELEVDGRAPTPVAAHSPER